MNAISTSRPVLTFEADPHHPEFGGVTAGNVAPEMMASLGTGPRADRLLASAFRVTVAGGECPDGESLPGVAGGYRVLADGVHFVPHFPFERGLRCRAVFDPRALGDRDGSDPSTLEFSLPDEPPAAAAAEVTRIFPSADSLPENLLRFYVCFSAPMRRGRAEGQIAILGPDGGPAPDVLFRAPVELWDRGMTCLTVLLDPGRLKRGVGPNVELGPPLRAGREYTLAVGPGMVDGSGRPLVQGSSKRFRVTEAVRESVAVERWAVAPPPAGGRRPLTLTFPRPLDRALLSQSITVASSAGDRVVGRVVVDRCETRWRFTPESPWPSGSYQVRVLPWLEDVCGNSTVAPFDRTVPSSGAVSDDLAERFIPFQL